MQSKLIPIFKRINIQRMVVALCILCVCIATQRIQTAAWNDPIVDASRDALGALMAIMIATNYKWSDFTKYKIPYLVWTVIGGLTCLIGAFVMVGRRNDYQKADTFVIALGVFLMGYCIMHTVIHIVIEKYRPKFYKPLFIIWVVMMLLMIFSRSDYIWPECYFVLFLTYYLTEQTEKQRKNFTYGIVDGMILGFLAIQGHALLCRPYDIVRYQGNFCNPNHNCMFLCMCLAAILSKILIVTKEKRRFIVQAFYFLMAGVCYCFIFLTMSLSGYMTTFILSIVFLIAFCKKYGRKYFLRNGVLLVLLFVLLIKPTYLAVRYIPTIHPHVLFYFQEPYGEFRVHSWDSRDSEKYISFETFWHLVTWKVKRTYNFYDKFTTTTRLKKEFGILDQYQVVATNPEASIDASYHLKLSGSENDNSKKTPALTESQAKNVFLVRYTIYMWYINHLSMRGMPYNEQGFQLTEDHWIQDTHDIYLDYGINFGIPVMALFMLFLWWGIGRLFVQKLTSAYELGMVSLLIALVPAVFGVFEYAWGAGLISTVALNLVYREYFTRTLQVKQ